MSNARYCRIVLEVFRKAAANSPIPHPSSTTELAPHALTISTAMSSRHLRCWRHGFAISSMKGSFLSLSYALIAHSAMCWSQNFRCSPESIGSSLDMRHQRDTEFLLKLLLVVGGYCAKIACVII